MTEITLEEAKAKADALKINYQNNITLKTLLKKIEEVELKKDNFSEEVNKEEAKAKAEQTSTLINIIKASNISNTVIVYCKIPFGLEFIRNKKIIKFNGLPITGTDKATLGKKFEAFSIIGYGKTYNIDKDDWEYFKNIYKDQPFIINNLIYAVEDNNYGEAMKKENEKNITGFEPIDPNTDKLLLTTPTQK